MQAALAHYEQLGFEVMPYAEGMTWARLGVAELHLFVKDDHDPAATAAARERPSWTAPSTTTTKTAQTRAKEKLGTGSPVARSAVRQWLVSSAWR